MRTYNQDRSIDPRTAKSLAAPAGRVERPAQRNEKMDFFKFLAIYSVVFLHIKTGVWDWSITALTRYAVPYFFLVSGYFAYGKSPKRLLRQAGRAALMWVGTLGLVMLLCAGMILRHPGWSVWGYFTDQVTPHALWELLVGQMVPFPYAYHVWYIGALPILYLIWSGITAASGTAGPPYRRLAVLACAMLCVHFCLSEGLGMMGRTPVSALFLRNAWMDGFPFFALGAWMHEDREKIAARFTPGLAVLGIAGGLFLVLAEQRLAGIVDLFFGSALTAVALLATAIRWPKVNLGCFSKPVCYCGAKLTFLIYALHVPLHSVLFVEWQSDLAAKLTARYPWSVPVVVAILSTLLALLLKTLSYGIGRVVGKISRSIKAPLG